MRSESKLQDNTEAKVRVDSKINDCLQKRQNVGIQCSMVG